MKLIAKPAVYHFKSRDVVAVFLSEEYEKEIYSIIPELSFIKEKANLSSFKGKHSEAMFIPFKNFPSLILAGIGKRKKVTRETLRDNASNVVKICKKRNIPGVHIVLPVFKELDEIAVLSGIAEGMSL